MSPTSRTGARCGRCWRPLALTGCDKVPAAGAHQYDDPSDARAVGVLPIAGSTDITAVVIESAGTPVQNGTVVTFTSSLGTIEPREARTSNGQVTVRYVAGTQSGTAKIGAFSGGSKSEDLEILVGAAAAGACRVRADTADRAGHRRHRPTSSPPWSTPAATRCAARR